MNLQDTHTDGGQGRSTLTQRRSVCAREEGEREQATVKLIRTSCVYFALSLFLSPLPLYL